MNEFPEQIRKLRNQTKVLGAAIEEFESKIVQLKSDLKDADTAMCQARDERDMCEQALSDRDASIEQLKELLAEARDDIHDEVINRYPWKEEIPADMRRYERDMDIVHRIDKALKDV